VLDNALVRAALAAWLSVPVAAGLAAPQAPRTYELRSGHWFVSDQFVDRTVWVVGSQFRLARPDHVDSVVDLGGGYVVPPFAEGHNHWLEPNAIRSYVDHYLKDGVFYVRDMGNSPPIRVRIDSLVNRPTSVDFISANQGFTGPGGHPLEVIDQLVGVGAITKPANQQELEQYVFVVASDRDIDRVWPIFLSGHPDFVKVFLLYSEEYARRRDDARFGAERGIDPSLLPGIVRRAHAAGLQVAAHIQTAADFQNALASGVDKIAHLPLASTDTSLSKFVVADADARLAAQRHIEVMTTTSWSAISDSTDTTELRRRTRDIVRANLRTMRKAGVWLTIGSDQFRQTSVVEAQALAATGVFTPTELLHMWAETTPRAIFPRRRIGRLGEGDEASFLVLDADPSVDFNNTSRIRLRMKQGAWLMASSH
jgi:predicted amidohydrolase YtcJ